jgi:sterol desaturase/sphingolipid hydroxylase (fatty acid hydroxylase superfamily)
MPLAVYALPAALLILFALERVVPLREPKRPLGRRLAVNVCVGALALATAALVVRPVVSALLDRSPELGLLSLIEAPEAARAIVGFLLFDLSFYYWHRANHVSRFLWRFHNAHHIDPDLDVSTSFRFHFVEIGLSAGFRAVQIVLIGGSPWIFAVYELAFQLNNLFQHSNVRLPVAAERWLGLVLMTPRMHGIHHSRVREENSSNWSTVLSCWDRMHGTLRLDVPQERIVIGIPGYSRPEDNAVRNVLLGPLRAQRDYWQTGAATRAPAPQGDDRAK